MNSVVGRRRKLQLINVDSHDRNGSFVHSWQFYRHSPHYDATAYKTLPSGLLETQTPHPAQQ